MKTRTQSAPKFLALSLIAISLLTFGMPPDASARGNGNRPNVSRPSHGGHGGGRPNRPNRPNVNHNNNTNININVDGDRHGHRSHHRHPVATAAAVTAAVVVTSAVVGSVVRANQMPSNCVQVIRYNTAYMQCGSSWYQPQYQGSNVTYVVINQPY